MEYITNWLFLCLAIYFMFVIGSWVATIIWALFISFLAFIAWAFNQLVDFTTYLVGGTKNDK